MKWSSCLLMCLLMMLAFNVNAQAPKREFRSAWMPTIGNIDWPSKQTLSVAEQQAEFIKKLDFLYRNGFNAIIVQVRPAADAFYNSPFEPWSRYLTGKQGLAPTPYYDPLEFMISETHKRNMEFHAWFNPFRALVSSTSNPNPANHATKEHPEWLVHYSGKAYFDPGNPDVRAYVLKVINDVVKRYDVDAIHIDDYFYPYKVAGVVFNDKVSFNQHNPKGLGIDDWRRDNINQFVKELYQQTKATKMYVKVGISPFGIWRNKSKDILGSETNGTSCYDDLYADVKLWIEKKWLDYVAPQLYWEYGHRVAAYDKLLPWWQQLCSDRHLYVGLGVYRMVDAKPGSIWSGPSQILSQVDGLRDYKVPGAIMYSLASFSKIGDQLINKLATAPYFGNIAFPPSMNWLDNEAPQTPTLNISVYKEQDLPMLSFTTPSANRESIKYAIYKFKQNEPINLNKSENIIGLTQKEYFIDKTYNKGERVQYVVTALDRLWNESLPSKVAPY